MTYTAETKLVETKLANRVYSKAAWLCMPLMLVFAAPPRPMATVQFSNKT